MRAKVYAKCHSDRQNRARGLCYSCYMKHFQTGSLEKFPRKLAPPEMSFEDKFLRYVDMEPNSGCWIWNGTLSWGYGYYAVNRRTTRAHRVSYKLFRGPIPSGLVLDHLCRVRCCVNPFHLEIVTQKENSLRGFGIGALNSRKDYCLHGHSFSGDNLYIDSNGFRCCRECGRLRMKSWRRGESYAYNACSD